MGTIHLSIRENYCSHWSGEHPGHPLGWCGLRELAQNMFDAQVEFGGNAYCRHEGNVLFFVNEGRALEHKALLLGFTTKTGQENMIGQWGEGLKIGALALLRDGFKVNIRTGNESWTPTIEEAEEFGKERVLSFHIRKLPGDTYFHGVEVRIMPVSKESWKEVSRRLLRLPTSIPIPGMTVTTSRGDLLLDREGEVYVKGIFVEKVGDLRYGYNFTRDVELDRDRITTKYWDRRAASSALLLEAVKMRPDIVPQFFDLLQNGRQDVAQFEYIDPGTQREVRQELANHWRATFGERAIPVASTSESDQLQHLGLHGIVTREHLRHALGSTVENFSDVVAEHKKSVKKTYSSPELEPYEAQQLRKALKVIQHADIDLATWDIVDFQDENTLGRYDTSSNKIQLAKKVLQDEIQVIIGVLLHEQAHKDGDGDLSNGHTVKLEEYYQAVIKWSLRYV